VENFIANLFKGFDYLCCGTCKEMFRKAVLYTKMDKD